MDQRAEGKEVEERGHGGRDPGDAAQPDSATRRLFTHESVRKHFSEHDAARLKCRLTQALGALGKGDQEGLARSLAEIVIVGFQDSRDANRMTLRALLEAQRVRNTDLRDYVSRLRMSLDRERARLTELGAPPVAIRFFPAVAPLRVRRIAEFET